MTRIFMLAGLLLAGLIVAPSAAQLPKDDKAKGKLGDPATVFRLADSDKDGKLSREEFEKFASRGPLKDKGGDFAKRAFDRLDANGDGKLTPDEFGKLRDLRQDKGKAKGEPRPKTDAAFNEAPTAEQLAFFEKKIRPVLVDQCYSCHAETAKSIKGGLRLDDREALRTGGDTGPIIRPGDIARSELIKVLKTTEESERMPPKGKLSDDVIKDFETWVKMGAPDPRTGAKGIKHEIDIEKGRQFWAFQPVKKAPAPAATEWAKTEIDRFIAAGHAAKGVKPVADADHRTLARRLYLDIIGLPPTPEQVDHFVKLAERDITEAIEKTADQLLASTHFGERWGRHWLDVARYGESTGKSVNFNFPHAWRYRDYVIDAFNADKPFDQFVKEQLAGDLLPAANDREKAEHIVAAGFLAIGTKSLNERNRLQFELDLADEQIDAFSQAFLGVTIACARCHDHKFDPIPTKDYYSLVGIFRSTETCYGTMNSIQARYATPLVPLPSGADVAKGRPNLPERERSQLESQLKRLKSELEDNVKQNGEKGSFLSANGVRTRIQIGTIEARLAMYESDGSPKVVAMSAREKSRVKDSPVYQRGEPDKPTAEVKRGTPQVIGQPIQITSGSGRKELAEWVASKDNPLTARVYVNRVWQHLFGRGLVDTPDNFGATGGTPSNPQLLDHLAAAFVEHGWSTKWLIKHLVSTHTYRLSTKPDTANLEADPDNTLCWRMSPGRLDAETIRDGILAVSGNLDVKPPHGSPMARSGDGYAAEAVRAGLLGPRAAEPNTRSVYLPVVRDNLPESLELFDGADPSLVTGQRDNTTVPAQALFLMNNPFVIKQAETVAGKLRELPNDEARIREAYRKYYGRDPRASEIKNATEFVASYGESRGKKEAWVALCQAMFGSAEFLFRN